MKLKLRLFLGSTVFIAARDELEKLARDERARIDEQTLKQKAERLFEGLKRDSETRQLRARLKLLKGQMKTEQDGAKAMALAGQIGKLKQTLKARAGR